MLALSRKQGQRVFIGEDIAVRVIEIRGGQVKLGFEAPRGVNIRREELRRRVESGEPIAEIRDDLDHRENQDSPAKRVSATDG